MCREENGALYEGEWKEHKKNGVGKYTFATGEVYKGEFKNDKLHGRGKLLKLNGEIVRGTWVEGYYQE